FPFISNVYCKYTFAYGQDWSVVAGIEDGITQLSHPSQVATTRGQFVFNFPLEITFSSTNPCGWPRLVLSCYGTDFFGHDVIRGYGATTLPVSPGSHKKTVPMFVPRSSSGFQAVFGWLLGRRPEFADPTFVAQCSNRESNDLYFFAFSKGEVMEGTFSNTFFIRYF
ncbi:unnamed protein product, partial [Soboliphyme baturini]|uniref:B9 domain-containing protein 1 n=1 Tax=Soboliphyme baturini TaxID=241478 RepID=A0A183IVB4_9BILA